MADHKSEGFLSSPGKIIADDAKEKLFISDSNHNRILITDLHGRILETIGSGKTGLNDGSFATATFNHPQGMCLVDNHLYVADTENNALRKVDLLQKTVETPPICKHLHSPLDLVPFENRIYIAMAGSHQIWMFDLQENQIGPFAGTGQESRVDGTLNTSCFAQPSGITIDGHRLYIADAESSSVQKIELVNGEVTTLVGMDMLDSGDVDGSGDQVQLQHPMGIHAYGGKLFLADTDNHKIKFIDPLTRTCMTVLGTGHPGRSTGQEPAFSKPSGLCVIAPYLYIADTDNHRIVKMFLGDRVVSELKLSE
ncbi:MAG: hypothetical protein Q7T03_02625 [Deltaproteobacteria bacterium]|nr:hypothetical protein [Deltaproteobacteria bacterium]